MNQSNKPAFSFAHAYAGIFFLCFFASPLLVVAHRHRHEPIPQDELLQAAAITFFLLLCMAYARKRCANERMGYWRGVLIVAGSMTAGWVYFSMVFVFPALLYLSIMSVLYALLGDLRGRPELAPGSFQKLVLRFYEHRMHQ